MIMSTPTVSAHQVRTNGLRVNKQLVSIRNQEHRRNDNEKGRRTSPYLALAKSNVSSVCKSNTASLTCTAAAAIMSTDKTPTRA